MKVDYRYILLGFIALLCSANLTAQDDNSLMIEGRMRLESGRLSGKMEVTKNGSRIRIVNLSGSGKFDEKLDPNANYIFTFSQEGYVTKKIEVDTRFKHQRPPEALPFLPFKFEVTLFEQYEGVNVVAFNQPVAKITYDPENDDFHYDTDYSKSVQEQIAEAEKETEKAKKEGAKTVTAAKEEEVAKKEDPPPAKPTDTAQEPPRSSITSSTSVSGAGPTVAAAKRRPPPPPPPKKTHTNVVVLHSYTVGELGYPNLNAYGYINFGDGAGNREITKEQFDEYKKIYH